jgi:Centromere DNA-binding protein complex CBF3 subunit, domain 2
MPQGLASAKAKSRTETQTTDRVKTGCETEGEMEADRHDLAAQGLFRLLQQLRIIFQDSVIMRWEFPDHPIQADAIFEQDDYRAFAQDVELSLLDVDETEEIQIKKTLPVIAERFSTLHQSLARDISVLIT